MALASQLLQRGIVIDGQFELERQLGAGGMGTVWAATDLRLGRSVAIKFLGNDFFHDEQARQRFEREARLGGKIRSPHVVQVFAQGLTTDGIPYVVMELLDGEDLSRRIARAGACSLTETGSIVEQVCRALTRAHQAGLIHRDIKPHNIFVVPETGGQMFVKLLDFGIAKDIGTRLSSLTLTGSLIGTVLYSSPEQLRHAQSVGPSTDIWALGVVIYHMLTGVPPFDGETLPELILRVATGRFTPATEVNPGLPAEVDAFFERVIQPDLTLRLQTAEDVAIAFAKIVRANSSGVMPRPPLADKPFAVPSVPSSPPPRVSAPVAPASRPVVVTESQPATGGWRIAIVVAIIAAALGAAGVFYWKHQPEQRAAQPTESRPALERVAAQTHAAGDNIAPPPAESHAQPVPAPPSEPRAPQPPPRAAAHTPQPAAAAPVPAPASNVEARPAAPRKNTQRRDFGF